MQISELVDIDELMGLCESFTAQSGAVTAILDLEGNILVATGWQDICTCFHRINPLTAQRCRESDTVLAGQLRSGEQYNVYKCKNGLVDVAVPLVIEGEHIANFFTGQFFFEPPDTEYFVQQAAEFGFEKESYLEALNKVPIFSEDQIQNLMKFFSHLTQLFGKMGLAQKHLKDSLSQLQENQQRLNFHIDNSPLASIEWDSSFIVTRWGGEAEKIFGWTQCETLGKPVMDLQMIYEDDISIVQNTMSQLIDGCSKYVVATNRNYTKDRRLITCEWYNTVLRNSQGQIISVLSQVLDITERKEAEKALRESEQRHRLLSESMLHGIVYQDANGSITSMNPAAERILGKSKEEFLGSDSIKEEHHTIRENGEMFPGVEHPSMVALRTGLPVSSVIMGIYNPKLSAYRWISVSAVPIFRSDNSHPDEVFAVFEDISERKNFEAAIMASEAKYRALHESMIDGFVMTDMDGHIVDYNSIYSDMLGYSEAELVALTYPDITPETWHDSESQIVQNHVLKQGFSPIYEKEYRRKDGSIFPVELRTVLLRNEQGEPTGMWAIVRDITERKQVEEALIQREFFLRESQSAAQIGSYKADFVANLWESSEALDDIFGIDANYTRNVEGWLNIVHPEDRDLMDRYLMEEVLSNHNYFSHEYRIIRKNDGETRWVYGRGTAHYDDDGHALFLLGTIQDITERKQAEQEKLALEQQLQQAQKLESLGVLAGGIAHDFNNILQVINGGCSLIKMDLATAESFIPQIEKAVDRAAGLCNQMLAYAGKAISSPSLIVMWMLVDDVVRLLKASIGKNIVITTSYSPDLPTIKGDTSQLTQIVMNLILNASEAIGQAQGEIRIALTKTEITGQSGKDHLGKTIIPGNYLCLEVSDNGCGMDEDTQRRVFEPFFTTKFTGRGLGMSAVLGIITAHKGALQLSTKPGNGTSIKVYLPAPASDTSAVQTQQPVQDSSEWRGKGTVLLVEDEKLVRDIARTLLEEIGFTVIEASDGKEALDQYQKNADISLVLTDIGMPVMDGYTFIRELKKLTPATPVIVVSGFGKAEIASHIDIKDIAGLITKPYTYKQLREILKGVVEICNQS